MRLSPCAFAQKRQALCIMSEYQNSAKLVFVVSTVRHQLLFHLYQLDLLANSRQHIFFQPVELIKAAPGATLHQAREYAANTFEVKLTIAVEDQHLHHPCLICFRLPCRTFQHASRNSRQTQRGLSCSAG